MNFVLHTADFKKARRWFFIAVPVLIVLSYVLIASYMLRSPGVQYDEALYVNGALGGVDQTTFITKTFHGIPVLLMPYIGALKAYLYYPVFALFGVNPISMRLPQILITAGSLFLLYRLLIGQVGRRFSILILALTAFDASFIIFTRLDNGPVVLDLFLKLLGLYCLLRFFNDRRLVWLVAFWASLLAGVFNKLNFIWYVNAFVGASILLYGQRYWRAASRDQRLKTLVVSVVGYVLAVSYYLYITIAYHLGGSLGFVGWKLLYDNFSTLVDGSWFYNYALSSNSLGTRSVFWAIILIITSGAVLAWTHRHEPKKNSLLFLRFYAFIGLFFILLLGQIVMTLKATAGWHYFSLYPFVGILVVLSLKIVAHHTVVACKELQSAAILLVAAAFCSYQLFIYGSYARAYDRAPFNTIWSSAIYQLSDFAKSQRAPFVSLDWGTQTQLLGFDGKPNKYYEVFGPVDLKDPSNPDFQKYVTDTPNAYYVTHPSAISIFPAVAPDFFTLVARHGYQKVQVAAFKDHDQTIFVVYKLQRL
jgi:4-amino-4-deoxy-L-arabinose transferase-like glycosyltransferase